MEFLFISKDKENYDIHKEMDGTEIIVRRDSQSQEDTYHMLLCVCMCVCVSMCVCLWMGGVDRMGTMLGKERVIMK